MISTIIMAFDLGTKSMGIAIGQLTTYTARPLTTCKVNNGIPDWKYIEHLLNEWQPSIIIVGLPLNMDGSEQIFTKKARDLANQLNYRFGIRIILHDERLTTIEARMYLFNKSGYRALKKKNIDSLAATIILEGYLRYKNKLK